jgi:hypothetical protein
MTDTIVEGATGMVGGNDQLTATTVTGGQLALTIDSSRHAVAVTLTPKGASTSISFAGLSSATASTSRLVNISTRAYCGSGNRVAIGGFVISGTLAKRVLLRAVGPSLTNYGIGQSEVLIDPLIEVYQGASMIAANDNWSDGINSAQINATAAQVGAMALAAGDTKSSALLLTLEPGAYTLSASGSDGGSGIVLLEIYDADTATSDSSFVNLAARAYATTGDRVTIGGFVISGNAPKQVLLRAVGPTLATRGIEQTDTLSDPTIELHDAGNGNVIIASNDNWSDNANAAAILTTGARIGASPFDGSDTKSAALLLTLQPGVYSFVASGKSAASGIVLVEVYDAD